LTLKTEERKEWRGETEATTRAVRAEIKNPIRHLQSELQHFYIIFTHAPTTIILIVNGHNHTMPLLKHPNSLCHISLHCHFKTSFYLKAAATESWLVGQFTVKGN